MVQQYCMVFTIGLPEKTEALFICAIQTRAMLTYETCGFKICYAVQKKYGT